jgi:hypothetical protein
MSFIDRVRNGQVVLEGDGVGGAGGFSQALLSKGPSSPPILLSLFDNNNKEIRANTHQAEKQSSSATASTSSNCASLPSNQNNAPPAKTNTTVPKSSSTLSRTNSPPPLTSSSTPSSCQSSTTSSPASSMLASAGDLARMRLIGLHARTRRSSAIWMWLEERICLSMCLRRWRG